MNRLLAKGRTLLDTTRSWSAAFRYWTARPRPHAPRLSGERCLLVLARDCPPSNSGGVYRVSALLRGLTRAGWETDVIAGPIPKEAAEARRGPDVDLPPEARVHRWVPSLESPSWKLSPFVDGDFSAIGRILEVAHQHRLSPDAVLASGPRFSEFVAAMVLARRHRVPLILDYRDEWCENPLPFVERGPTDRFWERLCLSRSAAVVFTTEASRRHYVEVFPVLGRIQTHVVWNGWDDLPRDETAGFPQSDGNAEARCRIDFYGWLGDHWDFPEFAATLARAVREAPAQLSRCQFRFVGRKSPENLALLHSPDLAELTVAIPHQPFAQAQAEMRRSDALLLLNNASLARVLPGKLFEYVAARRPIILYGLGGEMEAVLRSVPGSRFVARGDAAGLIAALKEIREGVAQAELDAAPSGFIQGFRRDVQIERFLAILEPLTTMRNRSEGR